MPRLILFLLIVFVLNGCSYHQNSSVNFSNSNRYARGFSIEKMGNITKVSVFNPWEKAKNISVEYYLINKNSEIPDSLSDKNVIHTPIKRIVCMSTSHLGFIDVLNENDAVVGISGSEYVSNKTIQQRIKNGKIADVGYGQNLNYEIIVNQKPDAVMVYGVDSEVTGYIQKLKELGIPVIMNAIPTCKKKLEKNM